jgi:DNA-binding FadR family transcriptional regulator
MEQARVTRQHVVLVRNDAGEIVHTHQVIDFDDPTPLNEEDLLEHALEAAKRTHPHATDLVAHHGTKEDLERLRAESAARTALPKHHEST